MGGMVSRRVRNEAARVEKEAAPVTAHRHSVTCIAVCEEDGFMVTASEDRTLCLWDLSPGGKYKRHWRIKALHGQGLHRQSDSDYEISDAPSNRHTVASVQQGAMVRCPQPSHARDGHSHWVTCLHVDGSSSLVYSGSMDKTVKAWDTFSARCVRTYQAGSDWITGIHVRIDVLCTSGEDGFIRLWKAHPHVLPESDDSTSIGELHQGDAAIKVLLAPDRDHLLSGNAAGGVCYWHLGMGTNKEACLQAVAKTNVGIIKCMSAPYHEEQALQWSPVKRRPLRLTPTTRALLRPAHLQAAGQGEGSVTVFVGGHLGVEMWGLVPLEGGGGGAGGRSAQLSGGVGGRRSSLVRRFDGHGAGVTCMCVVDGTLFTGSEDACLRAWEVATGTCLQIYQGHLATVRSLRVVPYTRLAHLRDRAGRARGWKVGASVGECRGGGAGAGDVSCERTPTATAYRGGLLCSGACDLRVWEVDSGEVVSVLSRRRVDAVAEVGSLLLAASQGLVVSFDLAEANLSFKLPRSSLQSQPTSAWWAAAHGSCAPVLRPRVLVTGGKEGDAGKEEATCAKVPGREGTCERRGEGKDLEQPTPPVPSLTCDGVVGAQGEESVSVAAHRLAALL